MFNAYMIEAVGREQQRDRERALSHKVRIAEAPPMKRIVLAALIAGSLVVGSGRVAFADKGGIPDEGSCGFGRLGAAGNRADPLRPGASEASLIKPGHPGEEGACTAGGSGGGVIE